MKNKDINKSLKKSINSLNNDLFEKILENEAPKMETHDYITKQEVVKKPLVYKRKLIAGFTGVMLLLIMFTGWTQFLKVDSVVDIDINPSIEIKTNKQDKVIEANALNKDGKIILNGMNLNGIEINTAVNAVVGSMFKNGYISVEKSSVLVSVENNNTEKAKVMQNNISSIISSSLTKNNIKPKIVKQENTINKELREEAKGYNISSGKFNLIKEIIALDDDYTIENLSKLSIDDLMKIIKNEKLDLSEKFDYDDEDFDDEEDEKEEVKDTIKQEKKINKENKQKENKEKVNYNKEKTNHKEKENYKEKYKDKYKDKYKNKYKNKDDEDDDDDDDEEDD